MSTPFLHSRRFQGPRRLMKKRASSSPSRHQRMRPYLPLPGASGCATGFRRFTDGKTSPRPVSECGPNSLSPQVRRKRLDLSDKREFFSLVCDEGTPTPPLLLLRREKKTDGGIHDYHHRFVGTSSACCSPARRQTDSDDFLALPPTHFPFASESMATP